MPHQICGFYVTRADKSSASAEKPGFALSFWTPLSILPPIECSTGGNHDFDTEDATWYRRRNYCGNRRCWHGGAGGGRLAQEGRADSIREGLRPLRLRLLPDPGQCHLLAAARPIAVGQRIAADPRHHVDQLEQQDGRRARSELPEGERPG